MYQGLIIHTSTIYHTAENKQIDKSLDLNTSTNVKMKSCQHQYPIRYE